MKGYDSTLARMAGNIAGSIAGRINERHSMSEEKVQDYVARYSVAIARRIIELCRTDTAQGPASTRNGQTGPENMR